MHIEITLSSLQNRILWLEDSRQWPLDGRYRASITEFPYKLELSRTDLIAAPRELALKPAFELFQLFGWNPSLELIRDLQAGLQKR